MTADRGPRATGRVGWSTAGEESRRPPLRRAAGRWPDQAMRGEIGRCLAAGIDPVRLGGFSSRRMALEERSAGDAAKAAQSKSVKGDDVAMGYRPRRAGSGSCRRYRAERVDQLVDVEADRVGDVDQFDGVDPAAAGFHRSYHRLISAERRRQGGLTHARILPVRDEQFDQSLLPWRTKGLGHSPASTENEGRQVQ